MKTEYEIREIEKTAVTFFDRRLASGSGEVYVGMRDTKAKTIIAMRKYKDAIAGNRALVQLCNLTRNERLEIIRTGALPPDGDEKRKTEEDAEFVRSWNAAANYGRKVESKGMNTWIKCHYPIEVGDPLPAERKVVVVYCEGPPISGLPYCGYIRYAAGDLSCPFFVVYHGNNDRSVRVIAWNDCLPDEPPEWIHAPTYGPRGYPATDSFQFPTEEEEDDYDEGPEHRAEHAAHLRDLKEDR